MAPKKKGGKDKVGKEQGKAAKHGLDAKRSNKESKEMRSASTVRSNAVAERARCWRIACAELSHGLLQC